MHKPDSEKMKPIQAHCAMVGGPNRPYLRSGSAWTGIRLRNSVGLNPTSSVVVLQISRHKSSQYDNINSVIARRALAMAQIVFLTFS